MGHGASQHEVMARVTRSASEAHASASEREQSGAFKPWLVVLLGLAIMPYIYARIDVDVNMAEEAELWRLERGCASPRAPAMVDGMVPSWGIVVPLAQMNKEAGAATVEADAAVRQVQWQWPMVAAAVPPTPVVVVASAPPLDIPCEVVMAQARTDATEEDADSAVQINSTVQAARQRVREPTISEKRLKAARDAEAADGMQKAARKRKQHDQSTEGMGGRLVAQAQAIVTPVASLGMRRGRERANAPLPGAKAKEQYPQQPACSRSQVGILLLITCTVVIGGPQRILSVYRTPVSSARALSCLMPLLARRTRTTRDTLLRPVRSIDPSSFAQERARSS